MDRLLGHDERIQAFLPELDLHSLSWNNLPWPDKFELGLLQLDSRSLRLQGKILEKFLRLWVREFLPDLESELKEHLKVIFEEKTASLTRYLIRKQLNGENPIPLRELAEQIYYSEEDDNTDNSKRDDGFRTFSNRLIKTVHDAVTDTRLWNIQIIMRQVKGKTDIAGYRISAGEALIDWERHVWRPLRTEQVRQFREKYEGEIK